MEFGFESVCDQVRAGSSYLDMVADLSQLAANELDNRPNSSSLQVCDQLRACLRPG